MRQARHFLLPAYWQRSAPGEQATVMPVADTLTVTGHDGTVYRFTDVRYLHTRGGLHILTATGEQWYVSAFYFLHVEAERRHRRGGEQAMVPDPGEPPADDRDVLAAYECPAGGLCDCQHDGQPSGQGRWPRCPRCGCRCPLPGPGDALDDPDACPCCHYRLV